MTGDIWGGDRSETGETKVRYEITVSEQPGVFTSAYEGCMSNGKIRLVTLAEYEEALAAGIPFIESPIGLSNL